MTLDTDTVIVGARYPSRGQVIDYLEHYRARHGLSPHYGQEVTRLERLNSAWIATTRDRQWSAANVVVATGKTRRPVSPAWPGLESFRGRVLHSSEYRNGHPWTGRPVLVVGFGNSACEQAIDLVECGARPHLSVRSPVNVVPRDLLGLVPVLQLGIAMRHLPTSVADALAWPFIRLSVGDIRSVGLKNLLVDSEAVCDLDGVPIVSGGPTAIQGLYFCGQLVSPAGMLREIGLEARRIARHLAENSTRARTPQDLEY